MTYSLEQITTAADCDALLEAANMDRDELTYRKLQNERLYKGVASGSVGVDAEIAAVIAEISGNDAVLATLPEGRLKQDYERKLIKLRYQKSVLEARRERYGVLALLQKEYEISCIEKGMEENDAFVDAVNTRKDEI